MRWWGVPCKEQTAYEFDNDTQRFYGGGQPMRDDIVREQNGQKVTLRI